MSPSNQHPFEMESKANGRKSLEKLLYLAFGLITAALLMTTITFAVLYGQEVNKAPEAVDITVSVPGSTFDTSITNSPLSPVSKPENPVISTSREPSTLPPATYPTTSVLPQECTSAACYEAAQRLNKAMNTGVDPCDDFYEFACGRWNETEPIPEDRGRWGVFDILRRELSTTLHVLLNVSVTESDETALNATQKMQKIFHSCLDEAALNDQSNLDLLKQHITAIFPNFTAFPWTSDASAPTIAESLEAVARARRFGSSLGLFSNYITSDHESPRQNILAFTAASLGLERSLYFNETDARYVAYVTYLSNMFQLFTLRVGPSPLPTGAADQFAAETVLFERILAEAALSPQEIRANTSIQFNKMTLGQFAATYTSKIGIDTAKLQQYFSGAWENAAIDAVLNDTTTVNVVQTRYWDRMTTELASFESASESERPSKRRFFANYMVWQIARSYTGRLGEEFRNISRALSSVLSGATNPSPRWESCVYSVTNEFPEAVGRLYVEENFQKDTKEKLQTMVEYIFDAFKDIIVGSKWMTHITRMRALQKADNFAVLIGYDDYIVDDSARLNKEHEELNITMSYLSNGISRNQWATRLEGLQMLNGTYPTSWITGPAVVNAFYAPTLNSISFPAGILQPPFLGRDYPDYWNFGAVGMVIGHEITHGFDDRGSQFDADGSFSNWWDPESRMNFRERADQLVNQYGNYTMMGQQLNGVLTQGENIADNGGMKEAFYGYKNYIAAGKNRTSQLPLPGLSYTPEQSFFLANAQVWCSDFRPIDLSNQIRTGAHSPGRFRVIGPMQNFDEFSKAYSCPVGAYMNPPKKNPVW